MARVLEYPLGPQAPPGRWPGFETDSFSSFVPFILCPYDVSASPVSRADRDSRDSVGLLGPRHGFTRFVAFSSSNGVTDRQSLAVTG